MSSSLPTSYRLIAFDWDGTLFDSTTVITHCIQEAVSSVGGRRPATEAALHVIGLSLSQAWAYTAPEVPQQLYPLMSERYRQCFFQHQHDIHLFPGVLGMLRDLRGRGCKLAVATGKSKQGLAEILARQVEGERLADFFDATRTAEETSSKPNPQMLFELSAELETPLQTTLMVGDTSHDLQMAANAPCDAVAVSYGAHQHDFLLAYQQVAIFDSVAGLHHHLLQVTQHSQGKSLKPL